MNQEILSYLRAIAQMFEGRNREWTFPSIYSYILEWGVPCSGNGLFDEDLKSLIKKACGKKEFPLRQCFANSQSAVIRDLSGEMGYYEGFAFSGTIPVYHGWVLLRGQVVDLTWRNRDGSPRVGKEEARWGYFGVRIPKEVILERIARTESFSCVIDDPELGWPLLKGPRKIENNFTGKVAK